MILNTIFDKATSGTPPAIYCNFVALSKAVSSSFAYTFEDIKRPRVATTNNVTNTNVTILKELLETLITLTLFNNKTIDQTINATDTTRVMMANTFNHTNSVVMPRSFACVYKSASVITLNAFTISLLVLLSELFIALASI